MGFFRIQHDQQREWERRTKDSPIKRLNRPKAKRSWSRLAGDPMVPADPVFQQLLTDLQDRRFQRKGWNHLMRYLLTLESEIRPHQEQ